MQTKIVCFIFNQKNGFHWLVKCWLSFNRDLNTKDILLLVNTFLDLDFAKTSYMY